MLFKYDIQEDLQNTEGLNGDEQVLVLTDTHTRALIRPTSYPTLVLRAGEAHKNLRSVEKIWDFLHTHEATRKSLLVCIGGGTVTDMGGFAAATYKRGMRYINVPTTLLAMVDASTGGKTGFDHHGLKNEIGCFYPPFTTRIHSEFLQTLPPEEFLSGFAEMVKHALIGSTDEYKHLLRFDIQDYLASQAHPRRDFLLPQMHNYPVELAGRIEASIEIKENIVAQDPHEKGIRKALNFGHTIGHALEATSFIRGKQLRHGYAVMQGLVGELYLSCAVAGLNKKVLQQISHLMIDAYGHVDYACEDMDRLLQIMSQDKKNNRAGEINFTLLKKIGEPIVDQVVNKDLIQEAVEYVFSL